MTSQDRSTWSCSHVTFYIKHVKEFLNPSLDKDSVMESKACVVRLGSLKIFSSPNLNAFDRELIL